MSENIEREKVLKLINSRKRNDAASNIVDYSAGWNEALDQLESDIEDIPAADVRPERHGKWKMCFRHINAVRCSECNCVVESGFGQHNFCPNCGAKMDGKDGEKDC